MEPAPATPPGPDPSRLTPPASSSRRKRRRRRSSDRIPASHALCDTLSGWLILFLVVFTPWAFGTTQDWAVWTANVACYALGGLLAAKAIIRYREGYQPARWGEPIVVTEDSGELAAPPARAEGATRFLAVLTVLLLAYILISVLNARAVYDHSKRTFDYLGDPIAWLPYTYDRAATLFAFWQYLGLACAFWAVRDWLIQRTGSDRREDDTPRWADPQANIVIPSRLQQLLWVLCLNGALLALVCILQRASGTSKLLWVLGTLSDKTPDNMFGPWSYRGNAAQYFNLLWPVCLAFWLWAQERAGRSLNSKLGRLDGPQILLLPCAIFMAACPMISSSRGGAAISIGVGVLAVLLLLFTARREISPTIRWITVGAMTIAAIAALVGGWSTLRERILRTDRAFASGIETGTADFTFLVRMKVPAYPERKWSQVAGLSRDARSLWQPNSCLLTLSPQGDLYAQLVGEAITNITSRQLTNFVGTYASKEIQLAIVRRDDLQVFIDGEELATRPSRSDTNAPSWDAPIVSQFVYAPDSDILEAALFDHALTPAEIASLAQAPSVATGSATLRQNPTAFDATLNTNELVLPDGASAELVTRASDPTVRWLMVRRDTTQGVVAIRRPLSGLDSQLRGPMKARVSIWNPSNEPLFVGASLDGGAAGVAEVPPREAVTVAIPVRAPHTQAPEVLDLFVADEDGSAVADLPAGPHLAIRDVQLQTDGTAFVKVLDRQLDVRDLSDRMSGRAEVYANARRMASEYVWWGSGAGTFSSLYQFYLEPGQIWAAYAHQDWLETRITFGRVGFTLITLGFLVLFARSWVGRGLAVIPILLAYWWLALAGNMVHALFDFPFQVYSVFFLFLVLASTLLVLTASRRH